MTLGAFFYKAIVLLVLYAGGYLLLRYGMDVSERTSLIICAGMPVATFVLWYIAYRGKKFG